MTLARINIEHRAILIIEGFPRTGKNGPVRQIEVVDEETDRAFDKDHGGRCRECGTVIGMAEEWCASCDTPGCPHCGRITCNGMCPESIGRKRKR